MAFMTDTPFITAEIGVNFRDLPEAMEMIKLAKQAGADAVKFQLFRKEHIKDHPRAHELENIILGFWALKQLKEFADSQGIELFATPMYLEAVDWLEEIGVRRYKIRYADRYSTSLIKKVIETDKPYMISCDERYRHNFFKNDNRILMYCVPEYPPQIIKMPPSFGIFKGYSSHYPTAKVPVMAAMLGAQYIEVHVKKDGDWVPVDDPVSLTFTKFKEMVDVIRLWRTIHYRGHC